MNVFLSILKNTCYNQKKSFQKLRMTASNITTQDLLTIDHVKLEESPDTYQQNWVSQWMVVLQACDADDFKSIKKIQDDLQLLGQAEQTQIWQSNDHLKTPLEQMMLASKDTSEITSLFSQLYDCIERINTILEPK